MLSGIALYQIERANQMEAKRKGARFCGLIRYRGRQSTKGRRRCQCSVGVAAVGLRRVRVVATEEEDLAGVTMKVVEAGVAVLTGAGPETAPEIATEAVDVEVAVEVAAAGRETVAETARERVAAVATAEAPGRVIAAAAAAAAAVAAVAAVAGAGTRCPALASRTTGPRQSFGSHRLSAAATVRPGWVSRAGAALVRSSHRG